MGLPGCSNGKESACNGDQGSVSGLGRSPGKGYGNPLQCSCLEIHGQRSLVDCSPWGRKESDMTEQFTHTHIELCNGFVKKWSLHYLLLGLFLDLKDPRVVGYLRL